MLRNGLVWAIASSTAAYAAATSTPPTASPGEFADGGNTRVSGMMLFLGNNEKVYILDKAESNADQIDGHSAWGAVWDINTHNAELMDVKTNVFCASGMHLPDGSFATFGGNGAVTTGGNIGSVLNEGGGSGADDAVLKDKDGSKAIRLLKPCTSKDDFTSSACQWLDDGVLQMQKKRWYSAAEPLANGTIVLIGGFVNGGYVNRNMPNLDPEFEGGAAEPTYEFYPSSGETPKTMDFMIKTSGLNAYAHTYLLSSGLMFVQANISTMIWDYNTNIETALPDMPNNVARVYPASGATAMLPLTPKNNYNPTILFCGGSDMPEDAYGSYAHPVINTWEYPASKDCQRITPEPTDGSAPVYEQDDDMPDGRTMGQFITLPDGKLLVINGGAKGTAGYADQTNLTAVGQMPFDMSLAAEPVLKPSIYDPNAAKGSRWSTEGLGSSTIPRLYHSSALLLPDGSILVAGSNPNVDVNVQAFFPTTYKAEIFYPPYFAATTRPEPKGIPTSLSYGGTPFDVTIASSAYSGSSNTAAESVIVSVVRPGWTTHGMNMGQRYLQLENTYTVKDDGTLTLHVAQMPPNANIFQPGPAMVYVVVNGVPSKATMITVGSGTLENQPIGTVSALSQKVKSDKAKGSADASKTKSDGSKVAAGSDGISKPVLIGGIIGGLVLLGVIGAVIGFILSRRRRRAAQGASAAASYAMSAPGRGYYDKSMGEPQAPYGQQPNAAAWNASAAPLSVPHHQQGPYKDEYNSQSNFRL